MTVIDTPSCAITYDCHSDDSWGVVITFLWRSLMLCEQMASSHTSWGISVTTQILIENFHEIYCSIDWCLQKYLRVDLDQQSNQPTPSSPMTHAIFSLHRHCLSPSPLLSLSMSLYALFSIMFYLAWFSLNTQLIWCLIINHSNKLIWTTSSFHWKAAHNISMIQATGV